MELYISSYEYEDFAIPRRILHYRKTKIDNRNCLIIETDKPLIGQKYGLLNCDIDIFYLINRVDEYAFDTLNQFPIDVYILILKTAEIINPISLSELQNIAWACLYNNEADAYEHRIM
jgi:hypothetical protein